MKLDFEPKSNITAFDNVAMQLKKMRSRINDFLVVRSIVRNWQYVFLFRVGIKKAGFAMQLQSGKNIQINYYNLGIYLEFLIKICTNFHVLFHLPENKIYNFYLFSHF